MHDVDSVVEILAEPRGLHLLVEVLVGGRDHPDVDGLGLVLPYARDGAFLQGAQQLHLQRGRHLADLVEEQGAAVRRLEPSWPRCDRAGERPLGVAEQLALEQVLGDGPAVDRHERAVLARAAPVDLAGDELLAGSGRAGDQDADVRGRDLVDLAEDVPHRVAGADDVAIRVLVEPLQQRLLVRAQLVQLATQLDEEDRGAAEARGHLQLAVREQIRELVVAQVDGPDQLASDHQRQAHDRCQFQVDDALARVELRVVDGILDSQWLPRLENALYDRIREPLDRVRHVLALEVARLEDLRSAVVQDEDESFVRPDHLDQRVQQPRQRRIDPRLARELPREFRQPRHRQRLRVPLAVALDRRGRGDAFAVLEHQLGAAKLHRVAVRQPVPPAPLAVHHQLGALQRRSGERLAIELDGHYAAQLGHAHVAIRRRRQGRQRLDQRHEGGCRSRGVQDERRHQRPCPCCSRRSGSCSSPLKLIAAWIAPPAQSA